MVEQRTPNPRVGGSNPSWPARTIRTKMSKIIAFFQEVRTELEKVTWPKRDDLVGAVVIVCILSLVFAAILGFMDSAITVAIHWLIR